MMVRRYALSLIEVLLVIILLGGMVVGGGISIYGFISHTRFQTEVKLLKREFENAIFMARLGRERSIFLEKTSEGFFFQQFEMGIKKKEIFLKEIETIIWENGEDMQEQPFVFFFGDYGEIEPRGILNLSGRGFSSEINLNRSVEME